MQLHTTKHTIHTHAHTHALQLTQIGLAMARSIGDHAVKAVGVTAEPEVRMRKILPGDRFIVIASDGVSHMCYLYFTRYITHYVGAYVKTEI
jgi:serine/threonine protein phosphatase PrpC